MARRTIELTSVVVFVAITLFAAAPADVLMQADRDFYGATRDHGLDGWMSWFAEGASLPQENPPVHGKQALRTFYQPLFERKNFEIRWSPQRAELFPSGMLGYTSGRYTISFSAPDGKSVTRTGSYLTVWQKQNDGSWKVLADFGAPDAAATH